jgi:hypothetical protein
MFWFQIADWKRERQRMQASLVGAKSLGFSAG